MPDIDLLLISYCLRAYGRLNEQPAEPQQQQQGQEGALFSPRYHPQASFALDVCKIARFKVRACVDGGLASFVS